MNIATPQEQFASKKRLDALFRKQEPRRIVLPRPKPVDPEVPSVDQKLIELLCSSTINVKRDWLIISGKKPDRALVRDIVALVAEQTGVSENDIISPRRSEKVVLARHIAMFLAKEFTTHSSTHLARLMGGKDHTTILYGQARIEKMLADGNASLETLLKSLRKKLKGE